MSPGGQDCGGGRPLREQEEACFSISDLGSWLISPGGTEKGRGRGAKLGTCMRTTASVSSTPRVTNRSCRNNCPVPRGPHPPASRFRVWGALQSGGGRAPFSHRSLESGVVGRPGGDLKLLLLSLSPSCWGRQLGLRGAFLAGGAKAPRQTSPCWCNPGTLSVAVLSPGVPGWISLAHGRCSRNRPQPLPRQRWANGGPRLRLREKAQPSWPAPPGP